MMVDKENSIPEQPGVGGRKPVIESAADLRMIAKLMKSGIWEVPDQMYQFLPAELASMALNLKRGPDGKTTPADHTPRTRLMASRLLKDMVGQNTDVILKLLPEEHVHHHEQTPVTAEQQRTALLRAVAAERSKREAIDSVGRRPNGRIGNGNGSAKPNGKKPTSDS